MMITMNTKKNKFYLTLLTCVFLTLPVYAQEENNDPKDEPQQEQESKVLFDNLEDRTQKLNQEYNNNPILTQIESPFSQARFVPDIALITDFSYTARDLSSSNFGNIKTQGFSRHGVRDYPAFNSRNGFNLNYAELTLGSAVDPFFDLFANFHLSEYEFEIEEAFINTRSLPFGLQVKAGKFYSSFGRLNSQHSHFWDFSDSPLIYDNLLGTHNILEKGVQINYLLPTDLYLLTGIEIFNGENGKSFGNKGFTSGTNKLEDANYPNLVTGFIKTSLDFDNLIILGGLSYAQGGSRITATQEGSGESDMHIHALSDNTESSFAGKTSIFGVDLTAKYFIDSYRYLSFQSEFLHRNMSGSEYTNDSRTSIDKNQSGMYTQLVYKFNQQWRVGTRLDMILQNQVLEDSKDLGYKGFMPKYTAMVDFNPTEFSRLRLQFSHDRTKTLDTSQIAVNEILLQLNMAVGAHGAHTF